jgi:hypothetical protein
MKTYRNGNIVPTFLTLAIHRGERSASSPCRFLIAGIAPDTNCIEGWEGGRTGLHGVKERNISSYEAIHSTWKTVSCGDIC